MLSPQLFLVAYLLKLALLASVLFTGAFYVYHHVHKTPTYPNPVECVRYKSLS